MPIYNAEQYLVTAVESVLNQSCGDLELLALDDGSTDSSRHILESFGDARLKIVANETNLGVAKTLNRGLSKARGEFIARMDADDICEPSRFEEQFALLEERRDVAVCGTFALDIDSGNHPIGNRILPVGKALDAFWWRPSPLAHPTTMWRVNHPAWAYNGDLLCAQDYDLWLQLGFRGLKFFNIAKSLLRYRVHPESISGRLGERQWEQAVSSFRKHSGLDIDAATFASLCWRDWNVDVKKRTRALRSIAKRIGQPYGQPFIRDELIYRFRRTRRWLYRLKSHRAD